MKKITNMKFIPSTWSFINCDEPFSAIIKYTHFSESDGERRIFYNVFIEYCNFVLKKYILSLINVNEKPQDNDFGISSVDVDYIDMLNAIRYCLRDQYYYQIAWNWLFNIIKDLDDKNPISRQLRSSTAVSVLCPILSGPINLNDKYEMWSINMIFDTYKNENNRWIVLEGLSEYSFSDALKAIDIINLYRNQCGMESIEIDHELLKITCPDDT
jgi:hypothetical protein